MTEQWKDIKGYEGRYQVSNYGRIKSFVGKEKLLTPTNNGYGYQIIGLWKGPTRKNHYVHRLVAEAFVENPYGREVVNHLDFDKQNNNSNNLEWCTFRENVLYSVESMRKPRKHHKLSSTGQKYIYYRASKNAYRVKGPKREHFAKTLPEAIKLRDSLYKEVI